MAPGHRHRNNRLGGRLDERKGFVQELTALPLQVKDLDDADQAEDAGLEDLQGIELIDADAGFGAQGAEPGRQPMRKSMAFERNRARAPGNFGKLLLATSMLWDAQCLHGQQEPFKCLSPLRRQSLPAGHHARRQRRHDAQRDLPVCEVQTGVQHHRSMARDCRACT